MFVFWASQFCDYYVSCKLGDDIVSLNADPSASALQQTTSRWILGKSPFHSANRLASPCRVEKGQLMKE